MLMYKYEVKCNNCDYVGYEEDLIEVVEFKKDKNSNIEYLSLKDFNSKYNYSFAEVFEYKILYGCPECLSDSYSMDVEYKMI